MQIVNVKSFLEVQIHILFLLSVDSLQVVLIVLLLYLVIQIRFINILGFFSQLDCVHVVRLLSLKAIRIIHSLLHLPLCFVLLVGLKILVLI